MELITTQRFLIDLSMAVNIGWTVVVPLAKHTVQLVISQDTLIACRAEMSLIWGDEVY